MILRYAIRSLVAHRVATAVTLSVLAVTTAIAATLFGFTEGMTASAREGGHPRVALILNEEAPEEESELTHDQLHRLRTLVEATGGALVSPEILARVPLPTTGVRLEDVVVRGVDPVALEVHPQVRIEGRSPKAGEAGCVVGRRQLGRHAGFALGGQVRLGHATWPILGVIDAPNTPFESELWCDRAQLKTVLKREHDNTAYFRLDSAEQQAKLAEIARAQKGAHLRAVSESAARRERLRELELYFDAIYGVLVILVASMVLTGANTIYTSYLGRVRELATLMAIGYTRRRVMAMMTVEGLIMTFVGAALGLALAATATGHPIALEEIGMVFDIRFGGAVVALGLFMALCIGFISSALANLQIARVPILSALRE
jgi:putative ABC transport system permease protein